MATNNSWNNAINAGNNTITLNSGTSALSVSTDASATTVNIATGGAVKTVTLGSTNSSSITTVQAGSGGLNITSTNSAQTHNSGTGTMSISNDAAANTVNIATGAAVKLVQVGSTNTTSSLALKCGTGNFSLASASGTLMSTLSTGASTYPLQPAFYAYLSATVTNVTGDGTQYTVAWNTESFDQSNNFASNTFTAPVTGKYFFVFQMNLSGVAVSHTGLTADFFINGTQARLLSRINPGAMRDSAGFLYISNSGFFSLTAADTVITRINVTGGSLAVGVVGAINQSYFSGRLVC